LSGNRSIRRQLSMWTASLEASQQKTMTAEPERERALPVDREVSEECTNYHDH